MGQPTAQSAAIPAETPTEIPNETPPTTNQVMKRVGFWGIAALMVGVGIFGLQGRNRSLSYDATMSVVASAEAAGPYLSIDSATSKGVRAHIAMPHQQKLNTLYVQQVRKRDTQVQVLVTYRSTATKTKPGYDVADLKISNKFKPGTYQFVVTLQQKRGTEHHSSTKLADPIELSTPIVIKK